MQNPLKPVRVHTYDSTIVNNNLVENTFPKLARLLITIDNHNQYLFIRNCV